MRTLYYLAACLLISINSFAQYQDTYQPNKVYKENNVRMRVMMFERNPYNSRAVDYFDHQGRVVEHIQYDTSGKTFLYRTKTEYDFFGRISSEIIYNRKFTFDSIKKSVTYGNQIDTLTSEIEYDSMNRVSKRKYKNTEGKLVSESRLMYEPTLTSVRKIYRNDTCTLEITTEYEVLFIEKQITETHYAKDGSIKTRKFFFKNTFDKSGKLKRRKLNEEDDFTDPDTGLFYFRESSFQYTTSGLLIKRLSEGISDRSNRYSAQLFDYKFW